MGEKHVVLQERLLSHALRKLAGITNKSKTCVIFINQLRDKIGVVYGSPEVTTGGKALKFYASIRLDVRKGEAIKDGANIIGYKTKVKVVKNKLAPPFKVATFDMIFGQGISKTSCVLDLAIEFNLIQKTGSWFSFNGEKIGQGRENAKKYIEENPEVYDDLVKTIQELLKTSSDMVIGSDQDE